MNAHFRAEKEPGLAPAWRWYEVQRDLIVDEKARVNAILAGAASPAFLRPPLNARYFAMTSAELNAFFAEHRTRLDLMVMLDLLATAEAALRIDFRYRVGRRKKGPVSRQFRYLAKGHGDNVGLEEHILETWKEYAPHTKAAVGDFKGALKLRNWLAHGRHWTPRLGRPYTPGDVFDIASDLLNSIVSEPTD